MNTYTFENLSSISINGKEINDIKSVEIQQKIKSNSIKYSGNEFSIDGNIYGFKEVVKLFNILKHTKKPRIKQKLYNTISQSYIGQIYLFLILQKQ